MKQLELNKIYKEDCFQGIKNIPDSFCDLIIIDPPSGAGLVKEHWDQKMPSFEYGKYILQLIQECNRVLKTTGSIYLAQWEGEKNPVHMSTVKLLINQNTDLIFKEPIVWKKQRGHGARKGWLKVDEYLLWYVKDNKNFIWNTENQYSDIKRSFTIKNSKNKSEYKRKTNVWEFLEMGFGTCPKNFKKKREQFGKNVTCKPSEYFEYPILAHTKEADTVLIPFSGSGVGESVCSKLKRQFISFELN